MSIPGFTVACEKGYSDNVMFHKGDAKLLRLALRPIYDTRDMQGLKLSEEFFDVCSRATLDPSIFRVIEDKIELPAATDPRERFQRQVRNLPTEAYSYVDTWVEMAIAPGFLYRLCLSPEPMMNDVEAVTTLVREGFSVRSDHGALVMYTDLEPKAILSSTDCIEVLRSPILTRIANETAGSI